MTSGAFYDGLVSRWLPEQALRAFLVECLGEEAVFVGDIDDVADAETSGYTVICTYWHCTGDFALGFNVWVPVELVDRVDRPTFMSRMAASTGGYVLYGDREPPGVWSLAVADGTQRWVRVTEDGTRTVIDTISAPATGLAHIPVDDALGRAAGSDSSDG